MMDLSRGLYHNFSFSVVRVMFVPPSTQSRASFCCESIVMQKLLAKIGLIMLPVLLTDFVYALQDDSLDQSVVESNKKTILPVRTLP